MALNNHLSPTEMQEKNYYKILGIPRTADKKQIKKAYKELALKWHPDKHEGEADKEKAEKQFQLIAEVKQIAAGCDHQQCVVSESSSLLMPGVRGAVGRRASGQVRPRRRRFPEPGWRSGSGRARFPRLPIRPRQSAFHIPLRLAFPFYHLLRGGSASLLLSFHHNVENRRFHSPLPRCRQLFLPGCGQPRYPSPWPHKG